MMMLIFYFIVISGTPLPKLTWYSADGDIVDDTFSKAKDKVTNTLKIEVLTKKHFQRSYYCQAENNNQTEPARTKVTIDMRCE